MATDEFRPERWQLDAADAALATLLIPPHARRERVFEISCSMSVRVPQDAGDQAWHQLTVQANGARQWQRRVTSRNPGQEDGLDFRFRRTVPVGEALKLVVAVEVRGVRRQRLQLEAEEMT